MQDIIGSYVDRFLKDHQKRKKFISIFVVLAVLVASGVIWQMKLTGISMNADVTCGKEEHKHSEACYEKVLICGKEETEQTEEVETPPVQVHTHTESCYEQREKMVCEQAEHIHVEGCYNEAGELICEVVEHQHGEECKITEKVLICELEEKQQSEVVEVKKPEPHVHTAACYEKRLVCGKEEHTHTVMCMCDTKADLESAADWEATLPDELKHEWAEDLLAVAKSQLGYKESERNFVLNEDGERTRGYTRYGQWYGNAYGDWCAMYVSWCLNYAEIPEEAVPYAAGCYAWTVELDELELYENPAEYKPTAGDIIFYDYKGTGKSNHVGIVTELEEKENEQFIVHTIEGNSSDKVREKTYELTDKSIIGYGNLAKAKERYDKLNGTISEEEANRSTLNATIYTDETYQTKVENAETGITVTGNLPEGAEVKAYPVTVEIENQVVIASYDISIFLADGTVYEPKEGEKLDVQFVIPKQEEEGNLAVYYVPEEPGVPERMETTVNEEEVSFTAEHFSVYAVARAVDGPTITVGSETEFKSAFANNDNVTVQLTKDITVTGPVNLANKQVALDLNGKKLTAGGASLFNVPAGAELTIKDSQPKSETTANLGGNVYGNIGSYTENTLTYYVTESAVANASTGATQETLVKHDVPLSGRISAGGATVVNVTGGTVNLESGMLYNGTNRAFNVSGGTLNLQGGYIFGFTKSGAIGTGDNNFGGAVLATGGTTNISGTVLAVNEALNGGAIYAKGNTIINITGGIISGNKSTRNSTNWGDHSEGAPYRCGGGGIFMNDASNLNMTNGYITNNTAVDDDYFDGGGGVLFSGTSTFTMDGGYVSGNEAAGGAGIRSDWSRETKFHMNGGYIVGNCARTAEGGGVAITQDGVGYIRGGYINNNKIIKTNHWGGGGLFCSDGAYLYIWQVNITDNKAGGFGGGVAGCSTGRVYVCVKEGGAIYQNSAEGTQMTDSIKSEDHLYGKNSPVFMENGYEDYFCALNSVVEGGMLGGGRANWSGSKDGVAVKDVPEDAILEAAYVMGLTANPAQGDIAAAQAQAKVFINGNSSYTHGGGVLCNGYLLIGDKNPIAVGSRFSLSGTKKLTQNGNNISLGDYQFKFSVKDENGEVVSVGTSDKDGNITFDRLFSFGEELCSTKIHNAGESATFVYYLTEDTQQENLDIVIDPTQYRISVTITREDEDLPLEDASGDQIKKAHYKITGMKVEKSINKGETWTTLIRNQDYTWNPSNDEQHAGSLKFTKGATFTNQKKETTSLKVNKKWVGAETLPESIKVDLLRDGEVIDTVILSAENGWSYTWDNLANGHEYTVYEHPVPGYETDYITGDATEELKGWKLADKVEVGKKYLIVASDNTALIGEPDRGAYEFDGDNFKLVDVKDNVIPVLDITESMQWEATTITGKEGIYLKNVPSEGKHYLSYQNDRVQTSSGNTGYASRVLEKCSDGLQLYKYNDTSDIKYATKQNNTLKAVAESSNAVRLYEWTGGNDENIITITNTKVSKVYNLDIKKVSANDESKTLEGAEFQLLKDSTPITFSKADDNSPYKYDVDGTITDLVTGSDGMIHIIGLPAGDYVLKETEAPEGYELAEDTTVTLGGDNSKTIQIVVKDQEVQYELPVTGGNGTFWYYIGGLLFVLIPLVYSTRFVSKRRRR